MPWFQTLLTFLSSAAIAWFVARLTQGHERKKDQLQRRNQVLDEVIVAFEVANAKIQDQFITYDIYCEYSDRPNEWQQANSELMLDRREAAVTHLPDIRQAIGVIRARLLFIGAGEAAHELSVYVDHANVAIQLMPETTPKNRTIIEESRAALKTCRTRFVDELVVFAQQI